MYPTRLALLLIVGILCSGHPSGLVFAFEVPLLDVNDPTTGRPYSDDSDSLKVGPTGVTTYTLKEMIDNGQEKIVLDYFNNYGVNMISLPAGYAAGTGARIFGLDVDSLTSRLLGILTGKSWYGKFFEGTDECRITSTGANRIWSEDRVEFVTQIIPKDQLHRYTNIAVNPRSNVVELNYSDTRPGYSRSIDSRNSKQRDPLGTVARLVEKLGIYDLIVAIPGRYGPIWLGRTWRGDYSGQGPEHRPDFEPYFKDDSQKQIAWFFLDFNEAALAKQRQIQTNALRHVDYIKRVSCAGKEQPSKADLP